MKNQIIIRKATIKDLNDILRLNLDFFNKLCKDFDKTLDLKWSNSNNAKQYFKKRISGKNSFVEVVEYNSVMIGYLCGGISKWLSCWRKKVKYAELDDMFIDKKFRDRGIGGKLVKNFLNWCKKNKVKLISVTASTENERAISLYRKLGFKDYDLVLEKKLTL